MINDGTATNGRKGLPYDWQALLSESTATDLVSDLLDIAAQPVLVGAE